jgi:hypothetical protein
MDTTTENKLSFEELTKITSQVRDEKKHKNNERIKKGLDDAVNHITTGSYEKMTESASKGYDRTLLYTAEWTKDKDAMHDEKGNKKMFEGNVRLFDLIDKGHVEFKTALDNFFNKDGSSRYHCFFKKKYNDGSFNSYNIFVSWGTPETGKKPFKKPMNRVNQNEDSYDSNTTSQGFNKMSKNVANSRSNHEKPMNRGFAPMRVSNSTPL